MTKSSNLLILLILSLIWSSYAVFTKIASTAVSPFFIIVIAAGSVLCAAFFLSPILFFTDFAVLNNFKILTSLMLLGLFCTGVVYILYFKLIAEEGSRIAVTYSLLIPICGTILGIIFLDEALTSTKLTGCVLIMLSMKFILNLSLRVRQGAN